MANDNHLFSVTCYNVTMKNHNYYNEFFELVSASKLNLSITAGLLQIKIFILKNITM